MKKLILVLLVVGLAGCESIEKMERKFEVESLQFQLVKMEVKYAELDRKQKEIEKLLNIQWVKINQEGYVKTQKVKK